MKNEKNVRKTEEKYKCQINKTAIFYLQLWITSSSTEAGSDFSSALDIFTMFCLHRLRFDNIFRSTSTMILWMRQYEVLLCTKSTKFEVQQTKQSNRQFYRVSLITKYGVSFTYDKWLSLKFQKNVSWERNIWV